MSSEADGGGPSGLYTGGSLVGMNAGGPMGSASGGPIRSLGICGSKGPIGSVSGDPGGLSSVGPEGKPPGGFVSGDPGGVPPELDGELPNPPPKEPEEPPHPVKAPSGLWGANEPSP